MWVGLIALVGVAAETGVVMLIYLDESWQRWRDEGRLNTVEDLRMAVLEGAVQRVRPKLMTVAMNIMWLGPALWAEGTGAEVMRRICAPMVGGLVTSTLLTIEIIPIVYFYWRRWQMGRPNLHNTVVDVPAPTAQSAEDPQNSGEGKQDPLAT